MPIIPFLSPAETSSAASNAELSFVYKFFGVGAYSKYTPWNSVISGYRYCATANPSSLYCSKKPKKFMQSGWLDKRFVWSLFSSISPPYLFSLWWLMADSAIAEISGVIKLNPLNPSNVRDFLIFGVHLKIVLWKKLCYCC